MIIICTGGRNHKDRDLVCRVLNELKPKGVIVGDCPSGVDLYVKEWCKESKTDFTVFDADWTKHGLAAGPIRNKTMVCFGAPLKAILIAFEGGRGTADCVRHAKARNMIVLEAK